MFGLVNKNLDIIIYKKTELVYEKLNTVAIWVLNFSGFYPISKTTKKKIQQKDVNDLHINGELVTAVIRTIFFAKK